MFNHFNQGLLRRNLKHCSPSINETVYKALVRPQMEYCSSIWDTNEKGDVTTPEKVQCRAARFVKNDYRRESSASEINTDLGWHRLLERRAISRRTLLYVMHGLVDVDPCVTRQSTVITASGTVWQTGTAIDLPFSRRLSMSGTTCSTVPSSQYPLN